MTKEAPAKKTVRSVSTEGRTIQEAISKALLQLGAARSGVTVRILAEENRGLFQMRGAKPAKVRVTLRPDKK